VRSPWSKGEGSILIVIELGILSGWIVDPPMKVVSGWIVDPPMKVVNVWLLFIRAVPEKTEAQCKTKNWALNATIGNKK
jgi:hypothetical protein